MSIKNERGNTLDQHGFFSDELAMEFRSALQDQFGKKVTLSEAQQIGLRIAQFVFIKEIKRKNGQKM